MLDFRFISTVRTVEERAANAWPAETVQAVDGWRLRYADGVTRRANSVMATELGGAVPLKERLAAAERGWLGLFCVATLDPFRRQGAAMALKRALLEWGRREGAESAYLQVEAANAAALALYARLGFHTLYSYHYREAPR